MACWLNLRVRSMQCAARLKSSVIWRIAILTFPKVIALRSRYHVGDVMIDEADIYGDGVNIAARLENLADRNGICILRQVLDQIDGRIPVSYRELGRQNLKNIARPIEVFALSKRRWTARLQVSCQREPPAEDQIPSIRWRQACLRDGGHGAALDEISSLARSPRVRLGVPD
jgi:hypothetical protein